jgi:hypothetical protein
LRHQLLLVGRLTPSPALHLSGLSSPKNQRFSGATILLLYLENKVFRPQSLRFDLAISPYTPGSASRPDGFACRNCLPGWRGCPPEPSPPRPPIALLACARAVRRGTGILTRCPSPTAPALGLGPPHPRLISMAAEPSGIRWGGFAPPSRYSCRHSHSPPLHPGSRPSFTADGDAPLPSQALACHPRLRSRA